MIALSDIRQVIRIKNDAPIILNGTTVTKHMDLTGLSYEESGHTGFASSKQLNLLKEQTTQLSERINLLGVQVVPRRLDTISILDGKSDRDKVYLYVDNNGKDSKISIKELNSHVLKTVDVVPEDMQVGEYIFLKL